MFVGWPSHLPVVASVLPSKFLNRVNRVNRSNRFRLLLNRLNRSNLTDSL